MTATTPERVRSDDVVLYRIQDAMRILNLGKTALYEQLRSGRLRSVKQGRSRLIPVSAIHDYVALLENEAETENAR
jgi:excisionase family DNA binding protein